MKNHQVVLNIGGYEFRTKVSKGMAQEMKTNIEFNYPDIKVDYVQIVEKIPKKTVYEGWKAETELVLAGSYQEALFEAYDKADDNQKRIIATLHPQWFH